MMEGRKMKMVRDRIRKKQTKRVIVNSLSSKQKEREKEKKGIKMEYALLLHNI